MQKVWDIVKRYFKRYFIDAMSAMALGLFSSLILGLILSQFAKIPGLGFLSTYSAMMAASSPVVGSAIGVAIAYGLKSKPLVMFSSAVVGALGYSISNGGPVGCFVAVIVGAEIGNLISGRTPVDIVLVPLVTIVSGGLVADWVGPGIAAFMTNLGAFINEATELQKIPMGAAVSSLMGLALTAPISSAAISISLGLDGLAAGAAAVGCSAQMVGFAVISWRENKWSGLLSQGLGTSMLQFGNIMRRPQIWIAPTLAGAILGPISTAVFGMTNNAMGAGMGTSGLVGQFGAWATMSEPFGVLPTLGLVLLMHFILPAVLSLLINEGLRKLGWVRTGDMALNLK